MVPFEAETYLRLEGERLLLDRDAQQHHRDSPLELPAAALVVAGAIDRERATRVIADHAAALAVRAGDRGFVHLRSTARRRARGRLQPRTTMVVNRELGFAGGLLFVGDLAVAAHDATLRFRWRSDTVRSRRSRMILGSGGPFPWGGATPVIQDDEGNRPTVSSGSGGGSDSQWEGELRLRGTLSPTTAWLEIEGNRIELDRRVAPSRTWVEPIAEQGTVERFLWRRLVVLEMPFGRDAALAPAIAALRAAGALTGEEPIIAELEAVGAQLPGRHGRLQVTRGARTGGRPPEPWRSMLSRAGRNDGPAWTRVLGAVTPRFDDIQVAVQSISSGEDGLEAEFEVSPNVLATGQLGELPVVWWARDDRGNRYLGHVNGWSGGDDSASGTMRFWPPLHSQATELELVVSGETHQAVIAIPLGDDR